MGRAYCRCFCPCGFHNILAPWPSAYPNVTVLGKTIIHLYLSIILQGPIQCSGTESIMWNNDHGKPQPKGTPTFFVPGPLSKCLQDDNGYKVSVCLSVFAIYVHANIGLLGKCCSSASSQLSWSRICIMDFKIIGPHDKGISASIKSNLEPQTWMTEQLHSLCLDRTQEMKDAYFSNLSSLNRSR
jgi:hypothetical protein